MGILSWIGFGAIAGWIASILMGRNKRMGCISNIIVGIVGALIGGYLMSLVGNAGVTGFNLQSFIVAVVGAVILLGVTGWWRKRR